MSVLVLGLNQFLQVNSFLLRNDIKMCANDNDWAPGSTELDIS